LFDAPAFALIRREAEAEDGVQRSSVLVDRSPRDRLLVKFAQNCVDVDRRDVGGRQIAKSSHDPAQGATPAASVRDARLGKESVIITER
jgi:hypothetical protein